MPDVTVETDDDAGAGTAEQSAHEAAVAEGATAVQAAIAAESAQEAKEAAELALAAAAANVEAGSAVEAGVESAQAAAGEATVSAQMVHEALSAQTSAITALTEELRNSRKQQAAPSPETRKSPPPDRAPGKSGPKWSRR
jgi:hypothetical protein